MDITLIEWPVWVSLYFLVGGSLFPFVETLHRFGADEQHPHGTATLPGLLLRFLLWPLFYPLAVRPRRPRS